jgi:hypothetical protein
MSRLISERISGFYTKQNDEIIFSTKRPQPLPLPRLVQRMPYSSSQTLSFPAGDNYLSNNCKLKEIVKIRRNASSMYEKYLLCLYLLNYNTTFKYL